MATSKSTNGHHHYPRETAGRIMTSDVPVVSIKETVGDAKDLILKGAKEFETINYLYIIDRSNKLKGVISVKEVFDQDEGRGIHEVMETSVVSVRAHTDQEKVVSLALEYNLKAIPVLDREGDFLGVVPSDTILRVLSIEHSEDVLYGAGVLEINSAAGIIQSSFSKILMSRLPWLMLGLVGGILAAFIISRFEALLEELIILALFVPVIVYMSDAVGAQTQTIFIRAMAMDRKFLITKYIAKELITGFFISIILSSMLGLAVWAWFGSFPIAAILSTSLLFTIFIAVLLALVVPLIFLKMKKDTAVGSGPFSTILSDVLSILVYFSVAQAMIGFVGF